MRRLGHAYSIRFHVRARSLLYICYSFSDLLAHPLIGLEYGIKTPILRLEGLR